MVFFSTNMSNKVCHVKWNGRNTAITYRNLCQASRERLWHILLLIRVLAILRRKLWRSHQRRSDERFIRLQFTHFCFYFSCVHKYFTSQRHLTQFLGTTCLDCINYKNKNVGSPDLAGKCLTHQINSFGLPFMFSCYKSLLNKFPSILLLD